MIQYKVCNKQWLYEHYIELNIQETDSIQSIINKFANNISRVPYNYKNSLECLCLLCTGNEAENGDYDQFLARIVSDNKVNRLVYQKLDFIIFTTNQPKLCTTSIEKLFKNVITINIDIPIKSNFYYKTSKDIDTTLDLDYTYGLKSGPNYTFFKIFQYLFKYNTSLLLECDSYLIDDWIKKIYDYVEYANGFWISGSNYDGNNQLNMTDILYNHINGGVGIYATGCDIFNQFLNLCFQLLPLYVKERSGIPYDYCIYETIQRGFDHDLQNRFLWNYIRRQYTTNNLIYNYSTSRICDREQSLDQIISAYSPAIIHKK